MEQQVGVKEKPLANNSRKFEILNINNKEVFKNSSIYALSKIEETESPHQRLWWTFVLILGILGSGYQITTFLQHYFDYPTVTDLRVVNTEDFPAVTICNLNRMKNYFIDSVQPSLESSGNRLPHPITFSERRSIALCSKTLNGTVDEISDLIDFIQEYMSLTYEDRKNFGYDFEELIKFCTINGMECNKKHFTYFQSLKYGNCFTFKHPTDTFFRVLNLPATNELQELVAILHIINGSGIEYTQNTGARIVVHDPNEEPNPEEDGINIGTGFETSIDVKQTHFKRLRYPYKDQCADYNNDSGVRGRSRKDCIDICIQEYNLSNCSCIDPTIPILKGAKLCNISSVTDNCCLDRALNYLSVNGLPCKCPPSCFSTSYELKSSIAALPKRYKCKECDPMYYMDAEEHAVVKITYSNFQNLMYVNNPMYDRSQLFGNLGNLLSLWLGFSLFVAFDVIEKIIFLFQYIFEKQGSHTPRKPGKVREFEMYVKSQEKGQEN